MAHLQIGESLKLFGLSEETTNVLVGRFDATASDVSLSRAQSRSLFVWLENPVW